MITKIKTVYQCEFCKRNMFVKSAMEKHIKFCYNNPENQTACSTCVHFEETKIKFTTTTYFGDNVNEYERESKSFRCNKLDKMLYPSIVERRGYLEKYPDTFEGQEPMRKFCDSYSDGFDNIH